MSDTGIVESFPAMLRRVLRDRLKPDVTTFPDTFGAVGALEYPCALPGLRTPLAGCNRRQFPDYQKIARETT
jgi:hypothetical protein